MFFYKPGSITTMILSLRRTLMRLYQCSPWRSMFNNTQTYPVQRLAYFFMEITKHIVQLAEGY